jgi:hypothetical protein
MQELGSRSESSHLHSWTRVDRSIKVHIELSFPNLCRTERLRQKKRGANCEILQAYISQSQPERTDSSGIPSHVRKDSRISGYRCRHLSEPDNAATLMNDIKHLAVHSDLMEYSLANILEVPASTMIAGRRVPHELSTACSVPWFNIRISCSSALLLKPRTRRQARRVDAHPMTGNIAHVRDGRLRLCDRHSYARLRCNRLYDGHIGPWSCSRLIQAARHSQSREVPAHFETPHGAP